MSQYSKDSETSYALGTTLTFELLLRKPEAATKIYISPKQKRDDTYLKLISLAKNSRVPVIENNEKIFKQLSGKDNTMVIGEFKKFESELDSSLSHIVLVNPSNMGNLGTILRSGAAFGIGGIAIIKPAADAFDPKCVRSSMGAIFSLPFHYFSSWDEYVSRYGKREIYPFMLQATEDVKAIKARAPYSLVFGNEATGLPSEFLSIGKPLIIKQSSQVDSLNLDNAVSIALFNFLG